MKYQLLFLVVLIAALQSCRSDGSSGKTILLPAQYDRIETVQSAADCSGPDGTYRTVAEYTSDGYCHFRQEYDYQESKLRAVVFNDTTGYVINDYNYIQGPLAPSSIQVIKGHEFQLMAARPQAYFTILDYKNDTLIDGQKLELHMALDHRDNPVFIYYNRKKKRVDRIHLMNIKHRDEQIEIIFSEYTDSAFGPMPYHVQIHQKDRSDYYFEFNELQLNAANFERITPKQTGG